MTALYLVEQEIARRCGPFYADYAALPPNQANLTTVTLPTLQSSLGLGDSWTGSHYLLRRGLYLDPVLGVTPLASSSGFTISFANGLDLGGLRFVSTAPLPGDRIRRVAGYDPGTGIVTVDRPWTNPAADQELIELHYLDPANELRLASLAGLNRCYTVDRALTAITGVAAERDLTAVVPWILTPDQVYEVAWMYPGQLYVPYPVNQWHVFAQNGHVWLSVSPDPFPNSLLIYARRPISTMLGAAPVAVATFVNTPPLQIGTATPHGFVTNEVVNVSLTQMAIPIVGSYTIKVIDDSTFSLNGTTSTTALPRGLVSTTGTAYLVSFGPITIPDTIDVPTSEDYAVAAGVIAAWQRFPGKLQPGAQVGLIPTMAMAATEFTRQATLNFSPLSKRQQFDAPFPAWYTSVR